MTEPLDAAEGTDPTGGTHATAAGVTETPAGTGSQADVAAAAAESRSAQSLPRRRSTWSGRLAVLAIQVAIVAVVLVVWEWQARAGNLSDAFFSRPSRIFPALWEGLFTNGELRPALRETLYETTVGFAIASAAGFAVGVLFFQYPFLERVWRPFVNAANNMPRLALTPLFVLWLGIGRPAHIALVITMVFFVMLLNTMAGLNTVSRDQLLLARVLGASHRKRYVRFLLPSAVPSLFVGLQLGLSYSFMGAVIGEIISGGSGLGASIATYSATYQSQKVFADLFLIAIVATLLSFVIKGLERRLLRWRNYELRSTK
jgi:NitT/TauT family transport system permease protein